MKRLNYFLLGAAGLILASCSQEEISTPSIGRDGNFTVTVNLPEGYATRSLGDGTASTYLNVAVFDGTTGNYVMSGDAEFASGQLTTQVSFNLANGKTYKIAFFAQSPLSMSDTEPSTNSVYYFNAEEGKVTVNYDKMTSVNNLADAYDCFYALYTTGQIGTADQNVSVTLTRPVAQINWGTSDLNDVASQEEAFGANGKYIQTTLTATAYNTLNILEESVSQVTDEVESETPATVTLTNFTAPCAQSPAPAFPLNSETAGTTTYAYIAVAYLLVPQTTSLIDEMTLTIDNGLNTSVSTLTNDVTVTSASVQANYRTNIYGALLTTNTVVKVVKEPTFGNPAYDESITVWDGTSATTPSYDSATSTITINRASDIAGLAAIVNGTSTIEGVDADLSGITISLAADYDMGGNEFPMIGSGVRVSGYNTTGNEFNGTFDGQGHTISNISISGTSTVNDAIGVFPNLGENATVKNVVFDNLVIDASENEQAGVIGMMQGNTVSNIKVASGSITAKQSGGGIVGRMFVSGTITECENHANVTSGTNGGGIVGAAYYTSDEGTMTISNCNNYGTITGDSQGHGGIAGLSAANITGCNNYGTINSAGQATGGIVGQQNYYGTVSGCTNTGNVTGAGYGSGGIVGWVRYGTDTTNYAKQERVTVSGCNNSAEITGVTGAGGIVGIWYMCGLCENNTNTSQMINATTQWASGIIGGMQWTETGPTGVSAEDNYLVVTGNTSTTTMYQLFGPMRNLLMWTNSPDYAQISDNTIPE